MRDSFNEINITPLTDIFLVLLIIMMVIAPLLDQQGLNLAVPEVVNQEQLYECSKLQIQNFLLHNSTALQEEKQKRIHTTDYSILHKYYGNYLFPA